MNRRAMLGIIGGGVILGAAGLGYRVSRSPNEALKPWELAGSAYSEPRRKALSYAILAPNPHNQQPWLVDLNAPDEVTLYVNTEKLLPHTDPMNRQITVGLGCFLELMVMAAKSDGYRVDLDLFPQGSNPQTLDKRPIAKAQFIKDESVIADPLFDYALQRRSVKEPYDTDRPVPRDALDRVLAEVRTLQAGGTVAADDIAWFRDLTRRASLIEMETPRTHKESVDVFRIGASEVNAQPDGIDITGPMIEALSMTGLFTREASLDPETQSYAAGKDIVLSQADTGMGYGWLVSQGNTREDQIAAGRDWLRFHLATTREGISMQPHSQALQEYEEMDALYKAVHERLAPQGGTVQMLVRLGYTEPVKASPRWPLEAKIV